MTRKRLLSFLAVVAVLGLTAVAGWAAARAGRPPGAAITVPPAAAPAGEQQPAAHQAVAPFRRVVPPDVLAVAPTGVTPAQAARIKKIKRVREVIVVDGGAASLQGRAVNVFAVDPSQFRSWTPPATAKHQELWDILAKDRFVASAGTAQQLGLVPGTDYPIQGRSAPNVNLGGTAPLGVPEVDLLVSKKVGTEMGLISNVAIMVNAPGAGPDELMRKIKRVLGAQAKVLNLHAGQAQGADYLDLYKRGAARCPGLSWTVLAAIGQVESDHGRNAGVSSAGAMGPMQFMPATWKSYGIDGDGDGKADIQNPFDAIPSAAKYLCAAGAPKDMYKAVFAYNHADWYVQKVLNLANAYARQVS